AVAEAARDVDALESRLESDPERLAALDRRLAELHQLARKHGVPLNELATHGERLAAELAAFDDARERGARLEQARVEAAAHYDLAAAALGAARRKAAEAMASDISARLRELGMPHARFEVAIESEDGADAPVTPHGRDTVSFLVTTNPDQPAGPLAKVASGGELSRITLAIQSATAAHAGVPVAVYDEVDTGIGGNTANIVGRKLRELARFTQVICITHSAQVASAGDEHLLVHKRLHDGRTETALEPLAEDRRAEEIARMLGAEDLTAPSVQHAQDLIEAARR
ncbi:MAG: DNA repair protein RecN, partial [Gammaproteobacteria bacterium]